MRVLVFSTRAFDRQSLKQANREFGHDLGFLEAGLCDQTAALAAGYPAVCVFVNDRVDAGVLRTLRDGGTRLVALRSAGFNHVDLEAADALGVTVLRVPAYSPFSVAEHTVGLMLTLNRKLHRAYARVREHNFALDGLLGFDMHGRTVGIVGTGKIGAAVARILLGFGCRVLAHDVAHSPACVRLGVGYVELDELLQQSDILTLHCPLTPQTRHLINSRTLARTRPGVMLINTSRGALVDTRAVIDALKSGHLGYLGLDVYEEEGDLFFKDLSQEIIQDEVFALLLTFPNVVITAHQAFFTREALGNIADSTLRNVSDFERGAVDVENRVTPGNIARAG